MDPVQEIKLRLSIEEVVGQYVALKKAGRSLKGLCPFHSEKTPSFIVSPDKGIAYCFGCQKGGDIFRFIMELEHVDFRGALELLAEKAGVALPKDRPEARHEKSLILDLQRRAQEFFVATLRGSDGTAAREVLAKRGVDTEMAERFGIGAAPAAWDALTKSLEKQGVSESDLVTAGLAIRRDQSRDGVYDRFRSRLMFPLRDATGKVLAFTGRSLDGSEPKYLNSPESRAFSKGTFLFGLDLAKEAIRREGHVLLVEGQMDVLTCHQFGLSTAVATSGTAFTEHHVSALEKLARSALLCYDSDRAGVAATLRALQLILNANLRAQVVALPQGKDPDEALRTNREEALAAFRAPIAPSAFLLGVLKSRYDLTSSDARREAIHEYYAFVKGLTDPLVIDPMLTDASGAFGIRPDMFRDGFDQFSTTPQPASHVEAGESAERLSVSPEEMLIGLLLNHPGLFHVVAGRARGGEIFTQEPRRLFDILVRTHEEQPDANAAAVLAAFPEELRSRAELLLLAAEEHGAGLEPGAEEGELRLLLDRIVRDFVRRRNRDIAAALKEADPDQQKLLTEELRELLKLVERP